ncbi:hypothetical protein J1605_019580 [Eschrichtius robustus]|uniref:Uncharacterized protein n=1 Tax=Eschrichtius robustus TaxID=9764 RepID=A0AB34HNW1_ESCRO|nr:hypothetical protein J1605_019580 [Eschrichtius robustus]
MAPYAKSCDWVLLHALPEALPAPRAGLAVLLWGPAVPTRFPKTDSSHLKTPAPPEGLGRVAQDAGLAEATGSFWEGQGVASRGLPAAWGLAGSSAPALAVLQDSCSAPSPICQPVDPGCEDPSDGGNSAADTLHSLDARWALERNPRHLQVAGLPRGVVASVVRRPHSPEASGAATPAKQEPATASWDMVS